MAKRTKRLKKAIESYKEEIKKHFEKLDRDIGEKDEILARYHTKEIDRSLVTVLERRIGVLGKTQSDIELIKKYKKRLEEYKKKLGII